MSAQGWVESVYSQGAGTALTAAAEAKLVGDVTIPAGYMNAGRLLRLTLVGKASNVATTPGTLTIRVRWGGLAGTVLVASAAMAQNVAAQTDKTWTLEIFIRCLSDGATGTFLTWGIMHRGNCAVAAASDLVPDRLPENSLAAVTVDTTVATALSVTAQPSLATASIQAMAYAVESMN